MPAILDPDGYAAWLDSATAPGEAQTLLRPCAEALLASHPVSKAVGTVRNDSPALIQLF